MKQKCFFCEKKVGVLGFTCKCSKVFCSIHRLPEQHECSFDHKGYDRKVLKENIFVDCNFQKIQKI